MSNSQRDQSTKPLCSNIQRRLRPLPPRAAADPRRSSAIFAVGGKWVTSTVLHYYFFGGGHFSVPKKQAKAVRDAFDEWASVGIGLEFEEVDRLGEAEVRIGYSEADGSSASAVGRDVLTIPTTEPTTVYGWDLTTRYGHGTALHELGHVLGMEHEHQNPFAGIKWHEQAVYDALAQPPNSWDRLTTFHNILEKLSPQQVQGSAWDPDSIMEYEFEAHLIDEPEEYDQKGLVPPGTLSDADKAWAVKWYPGQSAPPTALTAFEPAVVELAAGGQADYVVEPVESRKYSFETKGTSDTLLVLFEEIDGQPRYLAADDDSGEERNAAITYKLFAGRRYIIRLRLYYPGLTGTTSLLYT